MNLNDFSYEENGRRYIDPNVSLNEQNAFVQNLRDTQAQRNTQIAQQTHNLGTDVPSHYGGLNGSEAYFNARYQTPQTNSLVANLKSAAQAQALNTALNNELQKAQKRYNDAYYAASARANGTTAGDDTKDKLGITTNGGATDKTVNQNDENKNKVGHVAHDDTGTYYTTWDIGGYTRHYLDNVPVGVSVAAPFMSGLQSSPKEGTFITYNGKKYLYSDGNWYQVTHSLKGMK